MTQYYIKPAESISLFVKNIVILENLDASKKNSIPFFADGCPGLMYYNAPKGLVVAPHNKQMPPIFLYGQTIQPITLELDGTYVIVIFQLYPFVLRSFFEVAPKSINDDCYYLDDEKEFLLGELVEKLKKQDIDTCVQTITELLLFYFEKKKQQLDFDVYQAIDLIFASKGQQTVQSIVNSLGINRRTLERRFLLETGLSPKQFAKVIQFQTSLVHLTSKDYSSLSDVVFENGFSDQSHFIRVFKAFTGSTPKKFTL
ncbi:helix-turn-helix domain-containing protein [Neptunitalea lumnitzerae]|uniref:HTH araC/xylS-type domain-containing protein n=1 Tax=Neptunitalea lumnitzerae TaxID=2965509 RepID=A0ABQ5MLQ1_9FLAO|nr:helix-turn-helix domain-containing protein [Neptunitalea sp. Y10]GLB50340.1 hypothetical protein Y10_27080 [Neptunitalea sp. Y10]